MYILNVTGVATCFNLSHAKWTCPTRNRRALVKSHLLVAYVILVAKRLMHAMPKSRLKTRLLIIGRWNRSSVLISICGG